MNKLAGSLDANAVLRLILNDIPEQCTAVSALFRDPTCRYAVSDLAVVEVEYALRAHYGFTRMQVGDTLGDLLLHPSIHTNTVQMKRVFAMYTAHPQLSFTDCCLTAQADADGALPLWTFDQKLVKQSDGMARLIVA